MSGTVTLWCVEFCRSSFGGYDYRWFATEKEAVAYIEAEAVDEGYELVDESTGEDWTMRSKPMPIDAELTIEGLLKFANDHAVDTGEC